jgi:aspartate racemase
MTGVLGVVGGMGPLASARFVHNIYQLNPARREQDLPRIVLDSDPGMPDRTAAILSGRTGELRRRLGARVAGLLSLGATRIVIPCFTAHHFVDLLEPELRAHIVSLIDVTMDRLAQASGQLLLVSTDGTRRARIFQNAPQWPEVADRVVLPSASDQALVHELIYQVKGGAMPAGLPDQLRLLCDRYACTGVLVGCTELHLVTERLAAIFGPDHVVDALLAVAGGISELLSEDGEPRAIALTGSGGR